MDAICVIVLLVVFFYLDYKGRHPDIHKEIQQNRKKIGWY
jgi:hypothetical protein